MAISSLRKVAKAPTVAITGASGLLGGSLFRYFSQGPYSVVGFSHNVDSPQFVKLDVRSRTNVHEHLGALQFDVCIHCAANPNVASCEVDQNAAWQLNVVGTQNVADACAQYGIRMIHISTDYVFEGLRKETYDEEDEPSPLQTYGETKLKAEEHVKTIPDSLIVRVPLLFGSGPRLTWPADVAASLLAGRSINADSKEIRQPTFVNDVCVAMSALIDTHTHGIIHVAPDDCVTKWHWGQFIARLLGAEPTLVVSDEASSAQPARPLHSVLRTLKLKSLGIQPPRSYRITTQEFLRLEGLLR